jgi:phosphate transport system permease protein
MAITEATKSLAESDSPTAASSLRRRRGKYWREDLIRYLLFVFAAVSVLTTVGIILVLIQETILFFQEVSAVEFFTGTRWTPLFASKQFGVLPLVNATVLIAGGAIFVALPLGLLSAIYMSEYASERMRNIVKPVLEILSGIPTVVYGYFALTFITPILKTFFPQTQAFNALSASFVMGVMILPLIASLSEDAMRAVPQSLRQAAYALGATKREVATQIVVPGALSGISAAVILGISRAIGETMIVVVAAGQQPKLSWNILESMETMTAYIVQVSLGDTPQQSIAYKTIFAVGMLLFVMTLVMNIISHWFTKRYREVYE